LAPTLGAAARALVEGSRMSEFFFRKVLLEARGEEHFCTRTRRLALERAEKVRELLLVDLENPPSLEELARHCGCHPQYLSRQFSETTGMTISLMLRRLRVERAAELLASGRMNVSEVALEVGYRSLSHFSQAFRAEKGTPPSRWLREGESKIRAA
jgi:AraC-like DNA-binding protein